MPRDLKPYSVVVPVFNQFDIAKKCIELIIQNTPSGTQIIVIDDASSEGYLRDSLKGFENKITIVRNSENLGFVGSVNIGFSLSGLNDVIIVNSDVFVVHDWAIRLQKDAYRSDLIATVTAMSDRGSIATVQIGDRNLIGCELSELEKISEYLDGLETLPPAVIPVGVGHCIYIKRIAISQVGVFSEEFSPGYGEEVDFCMRAVRAGFIHTLSNSVIVQHLEGASFGQKRNNLKQKNQALIRKKYPQYEDYVSTFANHNDVQDAIFLRAITHKFGIKVLIDGRKISAAQSGTSIVSFELVRYLSTAPEFKGLVKVLVASKNPNVSKLLKYASQITTHQIDQEIRVSGKFDIFFVPFQISNEQLFSESKSWARRSVMLQLDFIAFDNPFYHPSITEFRNYQKWAMRAGKEIDRILYNSNFVAFESVRALQSENQAFAARSVVGNGLDHLDDSLISSRKVINKPQIGVIGTSFYHKNRIFGLETIRQLQESFPGAKLHLIGDTPNWGSSKILEESWLGDNSDLKDLVIDHGRLSEIEKSEILSSLDLLLVPSLSEGFGLAPFDGLPFGVPSIFAKLHSTFEVLPDPPVYLSLSDEVANLKAINLLLTDYSIRTDQLQYLNQIKSTLPWSRVECQIEAAMRQVVIDLPRVPKSTEIWRTSNLELDTWSKLRKVGRTKLALKLLPIESTPRKFVLQVIKTRKKPKRLNLKLATLRTRLAFDNDFYGKQLQYLNLPKNLGYRHFNSVGWRMRLNPNKWFDTHFYLERNPDVEEAGINPFSHYLMFGKKEGRLVNYPKNGEAFVQSGAGTKIEISNVSSEVATRIYVKAGRNCELIIKGIDVLETSLSIHMSDDCKVIIESGQRIRGPLTINLSEATKVSIGKDCLFANSKIFTSDFHSVLDASSGERINVAKDVLIGSKVWVASDALVLKGSIIGSGSVIGAHSVISGTVPANSVVAGNPGRVVKQNASWDEQMI